MEQLIQEIRASVKGGSWMLALTGTLALPDICAALQSPNGRTDGSKYKNWVKRWLGDDYPELEPDDLWQMRCSMLHQGKSSAAAYSRIIFLHPGVGTWHRNLIIDALNLDLPTFTEDMIAAVIRWRESVSSDEHFIRNSASLMRWRPAGLPPYIEGAPVLS